MRRVAIVVISAAALLVMAGLAYAVNSYTTSYSISPNKAGTLSSAKPVKESKSFRVSETGGNRPVPIKGFSLGLGAGVIPHNRLFGGCSSSAAHSTPLPSSCKKSTVGSGSAVALIGPSSNRSAQYSSRCYVDLLLVNSTRKNHIFIRFDTRDTTSNPSFTCPFKRHEAIDAVFSERARVAARGKKGSTKLHSWAIRFSPPADLQTSSGNDVSVIQGSLTINKRVTVRFVGKGKRRRKITNGFIDTVGCPKNPPGKRTVTDLFSDTSGANSSAETNATCK